MVTQSKFLLSLYHKITIMRRFILLLSLLFAIFTPICSGSNTTDAKRYNIGDIYDKDGKRGVVFEVWNGGTAGKIVSMKQSAVELKWAADASEQKRILGATNTKYGALNMDIITQIENWQQRYPAFAWCAELGEGWYLPATEELKRIYDNKALLEDNLEDRLATFWYWSSTEHDQFRAWFVLMYNGYMFYESRYTASSYVRAVATFGDCSAYIESLSAPAEKPIEKRRYKVGDFYDENGKKGIVFEVDQSGYNGKIISTTVTSQPTQWASDITEAQRIIGTTDTENGATNLNIVKQIPYWQNKYPAFAYCAALGEDWYLPATKELEKIYQLRNSILPYLERPFNRCWSSTESSERFSNSTRAEYLSANDGSISSSHKDMEMDVCAVAIFGDKSIYLKDVVNSSTEHKTYKVGDLYSENGMEGVVFEIDATGQHGKIVSLTHSQMPLSWCSDKGELQLIGANNRYHGSKNISVVMCQPNWQQRYPAFAWCAALGYGWYLPAKEEMAKLYSNKSILDQKLTDPIENNWYWFSTEYNTSNAWIIYMFSGATYFGKKGDKYLVRAVAVF